MKKGFLALLILLGLVVVVPFVGPWIGLAGYRDSAPAPGENVPLSNGRTFNVYRGGSGPIVVLVHGLPGFGELMAPLGRELAKNGFSWLSYDRSGWGYSSPRGDHEAANPTNNATDLLALLSAEKINDAYLVGYSYGGGVVLEALRLDHDSASCAGLISSVGDNTRRVQQSPLARIVGSAPVLTWAFGTGFTARYFSANVFEQLFAPEQPPPQAWIDRFIASTASPGVTRTWERENVERYLNFEGYQPSAITTPTLIIHGSGDVIVAPSGATHLNNTIPTSKLKLIEPGGHGIVASQTNQLATLLADWYDSHCR